MKVILLWRDIGIMALVLILVIVAALLIVIAHEQQQVSLDLAAAMAKLQAQQDEQREQNAALQAQIRELRTQLCQALDYGRCVEAIK